MLEDDTDTREAIVEYLTMEGADVSHAASGAEGFGAFVLVHPKVIISDLWMPNGDGYEFIRRVRGLPPSMGGATPALAVSSAENRRRALKEGFEGFLAKPFDLAVLTDKLARLANHP